jgi:cell division protein FtsW
MDTVAEKNIQASKLAPRTNSAVPKGRTEVWIFDPYLLAALISIVTLGLIMVTSSSISMAQKTTSQPFYYAMHQAAFIFLGLVSSVILWGLSLKTLQKLSMFALFGVMGLLLAVFIPGLGKTVNGSTRWLNLGITAVQVSEIAKLGMILFMSHYIAKYGVSLQKSAIRFFVPLIILGILGCLLLLEPDFGATVVITGTTLGLLFLAGVRLTWFALLVAGAASALAFLAISAPYRLQRLTSFLNPWADQFDTGYQLTQALIAFGRGEWFGVGLGSSVQKLFYLPEAHTDFIFAVLAEELGLVGAISVIVLYGLFVFRGFKIGMAAVERNEIFGGFVSYGVVLWIGLQALISIGVNTGVLPTKGLTLPFISYGGSSLVVMCVAVSLLLKVDYQNRLQHSPYYNKRKLFRDVYARD